MTTETIHNTTNIYRSSQRPDVITDERDLAQTIAWADANPHHTDRVTENGAIVRQLGGV
jgi:hypothetical protein